MKNLKNKIISKIKRLIFRFINYFFRKLFTYKEIIKFTNDLIDIADSNRPLTWLPWYKDIYHKIFEYSKNAQIEGDYLEFGVEYGNTFIIAYHTARKLNLKSMNFFAFDSFQGLPEIRGIDAEVRHFEEGTFATEKQVFLRRLKQNKVDINKVYTVPGWFNETLTNDTKKKLIIKKASVIMVDCDLYESTVPVLDFIVDYLQDGTIIIFDDWFCFKEIQIEENKGLLENGLNEIPL